MSAWAIASLEGSKSIRESIPAISYARISDFPNGDFAAVATHPLIALVTSRSESIAAH
ncbi:hypothetical protein U91I_03491 [alpha proteobacterium U9-1i]|nr:hypothetical protein U91I_03491 [alpha proteobacterium U9-1i]